MEASSLIGPTISATSALVSFYFSLKSRAAIKTQQRMQLLSLQRQSDADLRQWAGEAVTVLSEAITLCHDDCIEWHGKNFVEQRRSILSRLSALTDRGRWFLPNEKADSHGQTKPVAYRGFRPAALDSLVAAIALLKNFVGGDSTHNQEVRRQLVAHKREFVSAIQEKLDPRTRDMLLSATARGVLVEESEDS